MSKSLYEDIATVRSSVILDDFIEYLECKPGDVRGMIRINIKDPGGKISNSTIVIPFSSQHEQSVLSESEAIRYLKYTVAKTILESISNVPVIIPNFIIKDD